jgi:fluoride exporter
MSKRGCNFFLVFVGGAAGTGVRALLTGAFPNAGALPVTLVINVTGALLLGLISAVVAARSPWKVADALALLLGTGLLGGYTTYGMFAVDADGLLLSDHLGASIAYGFGTVVLGLIAAGAGSKLGKALMSRRKEPAR